MPLYEYRCEKCAQQYESYKRLSEEKNEMVGGSQQTVVDRFKDNPRRLGKGWARLVGAAPLKSIEGYDSGGRIHQFLWRCSRIVSTREKGTARSGAMRSRFEPS
jgi:hypothetical protein